MTISQTVKIPILTYHSIDDSGSVISTSPPVFQAQMKFLKESNFNVISLNTLVKSSDENKPLPEKSIILTFDDGFQNFYTEAYPILNKYDFTATVFLITDHCGKLNDWTGNLATLEYRKLMNWRDIKELSSQGIVFGAHSKTHPDLTKISIIDAKREMTESKLVIENQLGIKVTDFAYPYGNFNFEIKQIAAQYFKTACSTNLGKVASKDDFFSLKRLDSYYLSNQQIFRSLLSTKFDWYISLRQTMREIKKRVL